MIPHGVTPADDQIAADIFGVSVGYWQDTKHWEQIRGLKLLNREGSRRRLYSKEQLLAARAEEERAKAVNEQPRYDLPRCRRRSTPATCSTWRSPFTPFPRTSASRWPRGRATGTAPRRAFLTPTSTSVARRWTARSSAVRTSGAGRPSSTGRPTVAAEATPRGVRPGRKEAQSRPPNPQAEERKERARQLLAEHPTTLTAKMLGEDLGVHPVHAERLLRAARLDKVISLLKDQPGLTAEDVQQEIGLHVTSHARKLLDEARQAVTDAQ